jgi:hypothetical protein
MNATKRMAQHLVKVSKHHDAIAASVKKCVGMTKAAKADIKTLDLDALSEMLEEFEEAHAAIGDESRACAEDLAECAEAEKAAHDSMFKAANDATPTVLEAAVRKTFRELFGNVVMPTRVRALPTSVVAIPRTGQQARPETVEVDPQFSKLVQVEDPEVILQK